MKRNVSLFIVVAVASAFALSANAAPGVDKQVQFGDPLVQPSGATVYKVRLDRVIATATTTPTVVAKADAKAKSKKAKKADAKAKEKALGPDKKKPA